MGVWWSAEPIVYEVNSTEYHDTIRDTDVFLCNICFSTHDKISTEDKTALLNYINDKGPVVMYHGERSIMLLFNSRIRQPILRSNVTTHIISELASELSIWILKNTKINIYSSDVSIQFGDYISFYNMIQEQHRKTENSILLEY